MVWCDGSEAENERLIEEMLATARCSALNRAEAPGLHLHRSHPTDVARTEHLTFICSRAPGRRRPDQQLDVARTKRRRKVRPLFDGAMKGRTMYVVPYLMGPLGSPFSKVGVEITDSPYVVASMRIMTRMGEVALEQLGASDGLRAAACTRWATSRPTAASSCTSPRSALIWSVGSGYGGNALLGKKCLALRHRERAWRASRAGWPSTC